MERTSTVGSGGDDVPEQDDVVRSQTFDADGPVELDVDLTAGAVDVRLTETDSVSVEVRRRHSATPSWAEGAAGVLNWVGEVFGGGPGGGPGAGGDAVHEVRIEQVGDRVVVRGPKAPPPVATALDVTVRAPSGSAVRARTRLASVTTRGECGRVDIVTASGAITLDTVSGSGSTATLRTSSGEVDVASLGGPATVSGGSAGVRIGVVTDSVLVRTTSGEVRVGEAVDGSVEAVSGSGDIRVGVRSGTTAEIDLSSGGGSVDSDLDVADSPPEDAVGLTVRARSGAGDVLVTRAT